VVDFYWGLMRGRIVEDLKESEVEVSVGSVEDRG
jgi:hypothetical protein